ncbi:hypothetical protein [Burkholderia multivorans]|uniref:hypothetical protein n=1 Tax=Burkholderia multivorans TaxID=87883 RepID=UPI0018C781BD|nr:hypothetical protein [Burkholderia multivorans]
MKSRSIEAPLGQSNVSFPYESGPSAEMRQYATVAKLAILKLPKDRTEETPLIANDAPGFLGVPECCNTFWIVF